MIIIKAIGGLGNQLFQYALGRRLSLERNTELFFDTTWYEKPPNRKYSLNKFNTIGTVASKTDGKKRKPLLLDVILPINKKRYIREQSFRFDKKILSVGKDVYLDGYWQSPKYFESIEDILKKDLVLKEPQGEEHEEMRKKIYSINSVSLHVRRGDFLAEKNKKTYTDCGPGYYQSAINYIFKQTGKIELFVFSDDPEWVKENLHTGHPTTFVSSRNFTDYQELDLMRSCKHNITANSTFSWWGAWLNPNPKKIVVTPKQWFVPIERNGEDLIPATWVRM
ncbi:MAG: alpha-1,2-fucosyltransferase [Candidatus Parcubacteria bacterium]|nr:alpha-1,2-fucosyltransferase [Candidatus Parcubacteria bacterium]